MILRISFLLLLVQHVGGTSISLNEARRERVCLVGSGNWGSAIARTVGKNVISKQNFEPEVNMWVFEELVEGKKLTEIINTQHENVKYLPGYRLPENVIAVPDLGLAVRGATILIFVVPHQFLPKLLPVIRKELPPEIVSVKAISLIKAIDFDHSGLVLVSDSIRAGLGGQLDVSVLMGANVANEVAADMFCEATIGYRSLANAAVFKALKNVIALAAGFCDGLGYGSNTKAAIIRIGLSEMLRFAQTFFRNVKTETLLESCGVADVITTCFNGRNRRCAEAFAAARRSSPASPAPAAGAGVTASTAPSAGGLPTATDAHRAPGRPAAAGAAAAGNGPGGEGSLATTGHSHPIAGTVTPGGVNDAPHGGGVPTWEELEEQLLGGQRLAGPPACRAVHGMLAARGLGGKFPLMETIHAVAFEGLDPHQIVARAPVYY